MCSPTCSRILRIITLLAEALEQARALHVPLSPQTSQGAHAMQLSGLTDSQSIMHTPMSIMLQSLYIAVK